MINTAYLSAHCIKTARIKKYKYDIRTASIGENAYTRTNIVRVNDLIMSKTGFIAR